MTHFCASDGARQPADDDQPARVSRAAISFDGAELRVHGGAMEPWHRTFERHSYEPELAAFADLHHDLEEGSFIVTITDCLSGGQAGAAFRSCRPTQHSALWRARATPVDRTCSRVVPHTRTRPSRTLSPPAHGTPLLTLRAHLTPCAHVRRAHARADPLGEVTAL